MSRETDIICIVCPNGCRMHVLQEGEEIRVTSNKCARGEAFAIQELTHPMRTLTTTVATVFAHCPVLAVKLSREVAREAFTAIMKVCHATLIDKVVRAGDIIVHDIANSGADLVVSSDALYTAYNTQT